MTKKLLSNFLFTLKQIVYSKRRQIKKSSNREIRTPRRGKFASRRSWGRDS